MTSIADETARKRDTRWVLRVCLHLVGRRLGQLLCASSSGTRVDVTALDASQYKKQVANVAADKRVDQQEQRSGRVQGLTI